MGFGRKMDTRGIKLTHLALILLLTPYETTCSSVENFTTSRPATTVFKPPICRCKLKSDCGSENIIVTPDHNGLRFNCDSQHVCCKLIKGEENYSNKTIISIFPPAKPPKNATCVPQSECMKRASPAHSTDCTIPNVLCYEGNVIKRQPTNIFFVPPPPRKCGIKKSEALTTSRIGNDDNTAVSFGEIQWMAIIQRKTVSDDGTILYEFACVGSILTKHIILTAASCVSGYGSENLKVRVGDFDMSEMNPHYMPEERNVHCLCVHPNFQPKTLQHDLALLYVDSPFHVTQYSNIFPICIDTVNVHSEKYDLNNCLVAGWGISSYYDEEDRYYSNELRKADVSVLPSFDCQNQLKVATSNKSYVLDPSFICTEPKPGLDVCRGDHGGPLACPSKENPEQYYQIGVFSWSHGGCRRKTPRVYASVGADSVWLHDTIQNLNSSSSCLPAYANDIKNVIS